MNNSTSQQNFNAAQIELLRKFLQTASHIPSTKSIQEVLEPNQDQFQQSVQVKPPINAGVSFSNDQTTSVQTSDFRSLHPVRHTTSLLGADVEPANSLVRSIPDGMTGKKYPQPDYNSMVFHPGTGYRFDRTTGLHYDANTGLFVNKQSNVLLRWNHANSTYTLVGRASDVPAPALAQDIARLMCHQALTAISTQPHSDAATAPSHTTSTPVPSSQASASDGLLFQRERSLSFEEMSPNHDSPSPELNKVNELDERLRRRSLSFDEMTPERDDSDEFLCFPPKNRSPSYDRKRDSNRSPNGSRSRNSVFPDQKYSPDLSESGDEDSKGWHSPYRDSRGWKSPRRNSSMSPSRNFSRSPRQDFSRGPKRDFSRSPRRHHSRSPSPRLPYRKSSPRRHSRLSPSPARSHQLRPSPNRSHSPERGTIRRFSPSRRDGCRLSRECSDSIDGRACRRSQSPASHLGRRQKNNRSEKDRNSTYSRRKERRRKRRRSSSSSSSSTSSSCTPHRANVNRDTKATGRRRSSSSRSPLGRSKTFQGNSKNVLLEDVSNSTPSCSKNEAPSNQEDKASAGQLSSLPSTGPSGFSTKFMSENVSRMHKRNLQNPGNIYGHMFPHHYVITNFIILTPLPPKGDRTWEDLEILLTSMLEAEGINFQRLSVFPGDGGAPFNYSQIHFKTVEDAFRWYMVHEGTIDLSCPYGSKFSVFMNFMQNNWKCGNCKTRNFALRHFCYKCFWFFNRSKKSPVLVSQLVTSYVGLAGLDCRFLTMKEVLAGLPPLESFNVATFELLTERNGVPLGLCVFKFKDRQESAAFYRFLQESCLNPLFIDIVSRVGLNTKPIMGHLLNSISSSEDVPSIVTDTPRHSKDTSSVDVGAISIIQKAAVKGADTLKFPSPAENDGKNPLLWWRFIEGYVSEEGGDIMKYLFEEHPLVKQTFRSVPVVVLIGPLPIPVVCDLMEYRNMLSLFLRSKGVYVSATEKLAICKSHLFGAPYNYCLLNFSNKFLAKEWYEKHQGKLTLNLENGSTWPLYLHYSKPNWTCEQCHKFNFPIRIQCFSCYKPRIPDHTPVNSQKQPTNSIGITGYQSWCATEELLFSKLPFLREMENLTIDYLKEPTGVPLGICVIRSATPANSKALFDKLNDALTDEIARTNIQFPKQPLLVHLL